MLFSSKKKTTLKLQISAPPGRSYYTNNDIISGTVSLQVPNSISIDTLKVTLYGICTSSTPDALGTSTFNVAESHHSLKVQEVLIASKQLSTGSYSFKFNTRIPGHDLKLLCHSKCHMGSSNDEAGLPPSYKFSGLKSDLDIRYGVRAFLEGKSVKDNIIDFQTIEFIPSSLFTAFKIPHSPELVESSRQNPLEYTFKLSSPAKDNHIPAPGGVLGFLPPKSPADSSFKFRNAPAINRPNSVSSSPTDSLYRSESLTSYNSSSSSLQTSVNSGPNHGVNTMRTLLGIKEKYDYEVPLSISLIFHQDVYKDFHERGVLKHQGYLSQHMRIILSSSLSPTNLFNDISTHMAEQKEGLSHLCLESLVIKLAKVTKSKTPNNISVEQEEVELLNLRKLSYDIDILQFKKITKECRTTYQYELNPDIFNCRIESDIPSFKFCNGEREYQLKVSGDLRSIGCQTNKKFNMNADIVILA
ncbi:hypothetical protein DASC09_056120 [Saccharomycopsis crataegensis]|uniref:Arrestin-like N-terminal domain-containing protein n=1 Tax=Saccharomycopsis crataegensis TaxID=43959 RepID=A0AAV5QTV9_9ASCO|nr:hypothetical protein DASC09_056120 [Saccharomycopsis crataegensis]